MKIGDTTPAYSIESLFTLFCPLSPFSLFHSTSHYYSCCYCFSLSFLFSFLGYFREVPKHFRTVPYLLFFSPTLSSSLSTSTPAATSTISSFFILSFSHSPITRHTITEISSSSLLSFHLFFFSTFGGVHPFLLSSSCHKCFISSITTSC